MYVVYEPYLCLLPHETACQISMYVYFERNVLELNLLLESPSQYSTRYNASAAFTHAHLAPVTVSAYLQRGCNVCSCTLIIASVSLFTLTTKPHNPHLLLDKPLRCYNIKRHCCIITATLTTAYGLRRRMEQYQLRLS